MDFTVEVTTRPITESDWNVHRSVLDAVPGTVLIEDPEEPILYIPVEADDPMKAAKFVEGLAKLTGLKLKSGKISPVTPDPELEGLFDDDDADVQPTDVVRALDSYAAQDADISGRVVAGGRLAPC